MSFIILGFLTGMSLILAIGAQNIFVIEQGLKKQYVLLVCLICSLSDLILIFSGILLFYFFHQYLNLFVELVHFPRSQHRPILVQNYLVYSLKLHCKIFLLFLNRHTVLLLSLIHI